MLQHGHKHPILYCYQNQAHFGVVNGQLLVKLILCNLEVQCDHPYRIFNFPQLIFYSFMLLDNTFLTSLG